MTWRGDAWRAFLAASPGPTLDALRWSTTVAGFATCPHCGERFANLTAHLSADHGITQGATA